MLLGKSIKYNFDDVLKLSGVVGFQIMQIINLVVNAQCVKKELYYIQILTKK